MFVKRTVLKTGVLVTGRDLIPAFLAKAKAIQLAEVARLAGCAGREKFTVVRNSKENNMETIDNDGLKALINLIDSVSKVIDSTKTGDYADRYLIYEMRIALQEFITQINRNRHDL